MPPEKKKAPLTDEEKFKSQVQLEQELNRLQRRYVLLENDRHQFLNGQNKQLISLNRVLKITRKEHRDIVDDLMVAEAPAKRRACAKVHERLGSFLEEYDAYTYSVDKEKQLMKEIDGQIQEVKKDVVRLQSQDFTDKRHEERVIAAIQAIETLENKLEVQVKKFGNIYMELCNLRKQISGLLREREMFIKIWKKLVGQLVLGKRYMLDLIEQATIAYDQREDWCNKLHALRVRALNDLMLQQEQMTKLTQKQDNNQQLEEFYGIKYQRRVMKDLEQKEAEKRRQYKEHLQSRLEQYKELMQQILEFTNEPKIDIVARKFYSQETENFTKFRYINDMMEEMENINDKLGHLHIDIEEQKALQDSRIKMQKHTLKGLQSQLKRIQKKYDISEEQLSVNKKYLQRIFDGVDVLFKICKCDKDPLLKLLGDNTTINQFNVLLYIEMIEKKVLQAMLEVHYRNQFDKKKISSSQRLIQEARPKQVIYSLEKISGQTPCPLCIEHELVSDVIDNVQHVMSRKEAVNRVVNRLSVVEISRVHNVSDCHLPKSRSIIQRRYQ